MKRAPAVTGGFMNKKKGQEPKLSARLQWHPAFYAGLQIELEKDAANLTFENEHQLGMKPKQIDVLIVKKKSDIPIQTNLGRIFKQYNIVEYKSPTDYLSIDDFYKVYGYACFYKAEAATADEIPIDEITITFVCQHYPQKLIAHWQRKRGYRILKYESGIFYIEGDFIAIQLIVLSLLSREKNMWLGNLTDDLQEDACMDRMICEYEHHKDNELYRSVMDIIVRANKDKLEGGRGMCDAFFELDYVKKRMDDYRKEGMAQGISQGMAQGISQGMAQGISQGMAQGITQGISQGFAKGIKPLVELCQEFGLSAGETRKRLADKFSITEEAAQAYMVQYWK